MRNNPSILSTRPLNRELIELAHANHIAIDEIPFININPVISESLMSRLFEFSKHEITAVFTSANALNAVQPYVTGFIGWTIYAMEKLTENNGFRKGRIAATAINARELAKKIKEDGVSKVVFFCGDMRRDELPLILEDAGIAVEEVIVYTTSLTPSVVDKNYDGILFFSPSAVDSYFSVNTIPSETRFFALGETTAASIRKYTTSGIVIAGKTSMEAMIQEVIEHFKEPTTKYAIKE